MVNPTKKMIDPKFFTELIFLQAKYKNQKQKHYNLKNII